MPRPRQIICVFTHQHSAGCLLFLNQISPICDLHFYGNRICAPVPIEIHPLCAVNIHRRDEELPAGRVGATAKYPKVLIAASTDPSSLFAGD